MLHLFNLTTESTVATYHYLDIGSTPIVSPDGRYALTRTSARWSEDSGYPLYRNTKHVVQIDLETLTIRQVLDLDTRQDDEYGGGYYSVFSWGKLGYTKDGQSIVVLDTEHNELVFFSAETGEIEEFLSYNQENVVNLIHDPLGTWTAPFTEPSDTSYGYAAVDFSSDRQVYIQRETIYNTEDDTPILTLVGHTLPVFASLITPDDRYFVTASFDGTVRLWNTGTGAEVRKWQMVRAEWDEMHQWRFGLSFTPDGSMIQSAGQLLDIETGERLGSGGDFSPDSRFIFRFNSGTLEIWGIPQ
jgi:WD40 repeat protein